MSWKELEGQKWVIGVSGGPDSMALLDLSRRHHVHVICAHVNYHHRPTADRDQKITEDYCSQYQLPFFLLDPVKDQPGNFQAWAREVRYDFFRKLVQENEAEGVLIAHQLDDFLETALMLQESGRKSDILGIREKGRVLGVHVERPLMNRTKQQLQDYCDRHHIAYGIDESNLSDDYRRNQYRHHVLAEYSEDEKRKLANKIKRRNREKRKEKEKLRKKLDYEEKVISRAMFLKLDEKEKTDFLYAWFQAMQVQVPSETFLKEMIKALSSEKGNFEMPFSNEYLFWTAYGFFSLDLNQVVSYCYVLDKIELLKTPYFSIAEQGGSTEAVTLYPDDFPITIRSPEPHDEIELRFGTKRLNRWFIDRKIPPVYRRSWPVVVNCRNEVILVPKIGCNVAHYSNNPTCFVIK